MENLKTMNDMIGIIRQFYGDREVRGEEKSKLWNVLSALRGPDETGIRDVPAYDVKRMTTSVIREAVLGGAYTRAANAVGCYASVDPDGFNFGNRRVEIMPEWEVKWEDMRRPHHFLTHVRDAFKALGLSWDKDNEQTGIREAMAAHDAAAPAQKATVE